MSFFIGNTSKNHWDLKYLKTCDRLLYRFICDVCNRAFTLNSTLKKHMATHGYFPNGTKWGKNFKCPICAKPFAMEYLLRAHIVVHTGESNSIMQDDFLYQNCQIISQRTDLRNTFAIFVQKAFTIVLHCWSIWNARAFDQRGFSNVIFARNNSRKTICSRDTWKGTNVWPRCKVSISYVLLERATFYISFFFGLCV